MTAQLLRFGLVGVVGYVVDSGVLYALLAGGMGFGTGRLISFMCAVLATWLLNRRFTFSAAVSGAGATSRTSLLQEWMRYLAAMSLGGLLNLCTYAVIMAVVAYHTVLPALAVAAGSLVGMIANFVSAKWWVYREPFGPKLWSARSIRWSSRWTLGLDRRDGWALFAVQLLFWVGAFHHMELPGLYMDAVNPDYMAARTLNPQLLNAVFAMPTVLMPILGSPYHGVQNYYAGLPVFALLGFNMLALRIAQGLFGAGILVLLQAVVKRATSSSLLAFVAAAGLATELAFVASFRTQNYIVVSGCLWLLCAVFCALPKGAGETTQNADASYRRLLASGVFAGLAVYSYFVFLFFVPVFLALGWLNTRRARPVAAWVLGFVLGMQTYVLGYASLIIKLGGFASAIHWLREILSGLSPMSSQLTLWQSVESAWSFVRLALENTSNELLIFGVTMPAVWPKVKLGLVVLGFAIVLLGWWPPRPSSEQASGKPIALLHPWQLIWLPVSFFALSLIFGSRLWAHHFSSLLPLPYLILALALYRVSQTVKPALFGKSAMLVLLLLCGANGYQQSEFFDRLQRTGGVGKFSNAINRMAEDALSNPADVVHVFPEWGFMMPFGFLTANQRPYVIDVSPQSLSRLAQQKRNLRVIYWKPQDDAKYRDLLLANGFDVKEVGSYFQRDQQPAFRLMQATAK